MRIIPILCSSVLLAAVSIGSRIYDAGDGLTTRNFTFVYNTSVKHNIQQGGRLEVWVPLPITDSYQDVFSYKVRSQLPHELYLDPVYGNRILHFSSDGRIPENLNIEISMEIRRLEQDAWNEDAHPTPANSRELQQFLMPDSLVPIDGQIAEEADLVVSRSGAKTPFQIAESIYRHLVATMSYNKSGVGWGNGDALYACDVRSGNCTDIHSLFIGMARSQNIPSRFIIGFPLSATDDTVKIAGYHCWAEFYIDDHGWLPVDITEALKNPDKEDYFFGRVDANRVAFTVGRDITIQPSSGPLKLNYFIYPQVLVNSKPSSEVSYSCRSVHKN